ncbi:MAG: hypothetical protein CVU14_01395 [Bacteroidetes bacterium HGW-Bacteroidetes-9]|jgi:rhodanese-related sulfurtransferase|nr:MAG: hypothetical protein CVU14_01395 [Bacteroidetes bacterium HGW-Bacteroidetes-9]
MKELKKTNRLTIVVIAIVLVFVVGLLTLNKPDIIYKLTPVQSLEMSQDSSGYISPAKTLEMIASNDGKLIFIDVRNSIAFNKSHLKNAKNIPVRELFLEKNIEFLQELEKGGQSALIYGETPQQANGPWMMLRQIGINNVMLVCGTYSQLNKSIADTLSAKPCLLTEIPVIDTAALRKLTTPDIKPIEKIVQKSKPVQKVVIPVRVEPSSGGGC